MTRAMTFLVSGHLDQVRHRLAGGHAVGVLTSPAVGIDLRKVVALGCPWAADNGCFGTLDHVAYLRMCARIRQMDRRAFRWLVIPDVVADHRATVRRFLIWYPILRRMGFRPDELAFVLQDGAEAAYPPRHQVRNYFIGGSTAWKESRHPRAIVAAMVQRQPAAGRRIHMGRVNTRRRLAIARACGADSVDGTGLLRYGADVLDGLLRFDREQAALRPLPFVEG